MMKKFISILLCSSFIMTFFTSCKKHDDNIVEYPEMYTPEYCSENYIEADPNLIYTVSADNDIGKTDIPGGYAKYYAIKDVPIDDYLLLDEAVMFAPLSYKIVKNKNNLDIPQQEILSYKIKSVLIYSQSKDLDVSDKKALGEKMVDEIVASMDGNDATAFQNHIIDCIETENYREAGTEGDLYEVVENIHVRVVFENYENLAWDSGLFKQNDAYYIVFYTPVDSPDGGWIQNWIPVSQGLVDLIP